MPKMAASRISCGTQPACIRRAIEFAFGFCYNKIKKQNKETTPTTATTTKTLTCKPTQSTV